MRFQRTIVPVLVALSGALLVSGCSQGDVSDLRAENKELRAEIRELREDVRSLRKDTREMRVMIDERAVATKPGPSTPTTTPTPTSADAGAATPVSPPPKQANVKIQIESNPRGATVFLADRILGKTPLLYQHPPGTEQLMLRIDKPGYRPRLMSLRPDEDVKVSVQLARQ